MSVRGAGFEERPVQFASGDVLLEGVLREPKGPPSGAAAFCHPYPPYGGDMHNNVVLAATGALAARGIGCLRFNFRGVGASGGRFTDGKEEPGDVLAALEHVRGLVGGGPAWLGGYSFGAAMAARAAAGRAALAGLILVSPPVGMFDFSDLRGVTAPVLVLAGTSDPFGEVAEVTRALAGVADATLRIVPGVDHFWHGAEDRLADEIGAFLAARGRASAP